MNVTVQQVADQMIQSGYGVAYIIQYMESSLRDYTRFIEQESGRNPDLRPIGTAEVLAMYIAKVHEIEAVLEKLYAL